MMKNHQARQVASPATDESAKLLHELQVHQFELQTQNEELRQCQAEMEKSLEKYKALYEFSPFGYFNLDRRGCITAVNLCGANFFEVGVSRLIGRSFKMYVKEEFRPAFTTFLDTVYTESGKVICEVALCKKEENLSFVRIEAVSNPSGQDCRLALIDISDLRRVERENVVYQNRLRCMGVEMLLIEERERRQLAATLHDQVGQVLALAKMKLGELQEAASAGECHHSAEEIRALLEQAISSSRSLTFELSPPVLYELGFETAVQDLCEKFQQQHGLRLEFITDREPKPLSDDMRIFLFRAIRELLVNTVKHAEAKCVQISCRRKNDQIVVVVADDGQGFNTASSVTPTAQSGGFGLFGIRERLHHLGGEMTIDAACGDGTRVTLLAPLQATQEEGLVP